MRRAEWTLTVTRATVAPDSLCHALSHNATTHNGGPGESLRIPQRFARTPALSPDREPLTTEARS